MHPLRWSCSIRRISLQRVWWINKVNSSRIFAKKVTQNFGFFLCVIIVIKNFDFIIPIFIFNPIVLTLDILLFIFISIKEVPLVCLKFTVYNWYKHTLINFKIICYGRVEDGQMAGRCLKNKKYFLITHLIFSYLFEIEINILKHFSKVFLKSFLKPSGHS